MQELTNTTKNVNPSCAHVHKGPLETSTPMCYTKTMTPPPYYRAGLQKLDTLTKDIADNK